MAAEVHTSADVDLLKVFQLHFKLFPTILKNCHIIYNSSAITRRGVASIATALLDSKFDDINIIYLITRLSKSVVIQYIDLLPIDQ